MLLTRASLAGAATVATALGQLVVEADLLYPMTGDLKPIVGGVVVCSEEGVITAVGRKGEVPIPATHTVLKAAVATPGIIDARATVGLSGILNSDRHDQEQLDESTTQRLLDTVKALRAGKTPEQLRGGVDASGSEVT